MDWKISGQYAESCNCDYLCPCIFTNPQEAATQDNCTAVMAFRIDEGHFGDTDLAGVKFALIIRSGPVMVDGDWLFAGVVDSGATPEQRDCLTKLIDGKAGGVLSMLQQNVVGDYRGVDVKPITFREDGLARQVDIADTLSFDIEGVSPRVNPEVAMHLDNTSHPANSRLALARARNYQVTCFGLDVQMAGEGNNGHFAPFSWAP